VFGRIFEFKLSFGGSSMAHHVYQRLTPYSVNLITDERVQGVRLAFNEDSNLNRPFAKDLLGCTSKRFLQVIFATGWRTEAENCGATFFHNLTYSLADTVERRLGRRVLWYLVSRDVKLHRHA
jgi:hypothetical protein